MTNDQVDIVAETMEPKPVKQLVLSRLVQDERYDYVTNKLFSRRNAKKKIFDEAPEIETPDTSWYHPVMDKLSTGPAKQVGSVLLTAEQEQALFLQFNYCRYKVCKLRDKLRKARRNKKTIAREMLEWYHQGEEYRAQIAQTNLALVLAMAKRTRMNEMDFGDLISEGNMALLRAVDKFDVDRGFKFSTYACRAILKAFSRTGMKLSRYRQFFPTDFDPALERSDYMDRKRRDHEEDCADEIRTILRENRADLTNIEQEVIEHRFAIATESSEESQEGPMTLEQVGKIIGVTKERVRQIQNKALRKIRQSLEEDYLV